MANEVKIETYGCLCGYTVDIEQDPNYPRIEPMSEEFYTKRGWLQKGMSVGQCPNCFRRGISNEMGRIIDPEKMAVMEVKTVDEVDTQVVPLVDDNGLIVVEQTGVKEEKKIVGDEIITEEVPVMDVVHRELTQQEKDEEIVKIQQAEEMALLMESKAD